MSLLSVSYKFFERLPLWRLKPVLEPQLFDKEAGFRYNQCITDQVFNLIYDVEHRFDENKKSGIVLADLTEAHGSQLCGTKAKRPITAFDLLLLL